jgi:hypothetical protein
VTRDWLHWHQHYNSPDSSLSQRLGIVQNNLRRALTVAPCGADGVQRLLSICAGEGRDVLPVLAEEGRGPQVRALLLELDPILSQLARNTASMMGLSHVEVRTVDAGITDTYRNEPSTHLILVSGVFGNITASDMRRTVAVLPFLLEDGGIVVWTRSSRRAESDPSLVIRTCFSDHGFTELSFRSTADGVFRVGMHQLAARPEDTRRPIQSGLRVFTFT